ncbi:leucine--tRNA ligase [Daejeonella sp.]|uniref:leucine--tRNA ligase n=1 Tax=Daejeonella sp. TaxID=2805397 RepID=UPI0030C43448
MDYQFRDIEKRWQKFWADNQTFKVDNNSAKPKYYVLDMFPYPSGAGLHVGHPLGYIASDIFSRYKRLKGFNVLHPMGYDSFGLPAEQYAIQTGQHPAITTETNINRYREQLDNLGFSFDWSREVRTSDPGYYKWTQWIFMLLFNSWYDLDNDKAQSIDELIRRFEKSGSEDIRAVCDDDISSFTGDEWKQKSEEDKQTELLKYRLTYLRESTVNWCPALGTVLANDEVKDGFSERGGYPVEQKKMMQWSMRITAYADRLLQGLDSIDWPEPLKEMQRNWIGKSVGALVSFRLTPNPSPVERGEQVGEYVGYKTADPGIWNILKVHSREHRKDSTEAENILWQHLRNNQTGYKIRRQHAIDTYIADFICLKKGLVIEVDGGYHSDNQESDGIRTEILNQLGFKVVRFSNEEVISNPTGVTEHIKEKLNSLPDRISSDPVPLSSGEGRGEAIDVFTTRVDTIFGTTFLVLAPEHELVKSLTTSDKKQEIADYIDQTKKKSELDRMADTKTVSGAFTGSYALHPVSEEKIPVWIADYVLAGYGTGAVMAVPSGDQRDWLFATKFGLPIVAISDAQVDLDTQADPTKDGKYINSGLINGLGYKEATTVLINKLEELGAGKAKVNYRLRDAIFGRQRYWGEPVPVYFKEGMPHLINVSELPLVLPEVDKYLPTESGEPPLGRAENWKYHGELEYELSTMPGWAGSSWYWLRYMDARNEGEFASKDAISYWKDVDLYIGGSEHATGHLLYSRFWNKFLKDLGFVIEEEPFKKLINQGMIQGRSNFVYRLIDEEGKATNTFVSAGLKSQYKTSAMHVDVNIVENEILDVTKFKSFRPEFENAEFILENGKYSCGVEIEKMSKSKFNVVNPDELAERYGADTLRMYEMFLGPLEQSKPWNTNGIEGVFKFLRKFWKLFHDDEFNFNVSEAEPAKAEYKALHKIIRKVEEDIERFSFNTSVSSFMICVNELTDLKCNKRKILHDLVIVLQPYAPHITEELWTLLGNEAGKISAANYPEFNPEYLVENEFSYPVSINGKTRLNLNISLALPQAEVEPIILENEDVKKYLEGRTPKKIIFVKGKIINVVV